MSGEAPEVLSTLVAWGQTLTEPLLSLRQRARFADDLARLHSASPDVVHLFFAGFVSDQIRTLPDLDPWRHLSARFGGVTAGAAPPEQDGAVTPSRTVFGTWSDAVDVVPLVHASSFEDPGLMALAGDDLSAAAAAIIGAASHGWRRTLDMIEAVWRAPVADSPDLAAVADIRARDSYKRGVALHRVREAAEQAARWSVHRRRAYLGPGDEWPSESAFRWAWRAQRTANDQPWADQDVEAAIRVEAILRPYPPEPLVDEF